MNKQELIGTLRKLLTKPSEGTDFDYGHDYGIQRAIYLAEDLDEQQAPINKPEKPVVPQFVADFYESIKDDFEYKVYELCLQYKHRGDELPQGVAWWFGDSRNKPIETLVMMHKFGYEVKKEKLYTVELPNPNYGERPILYKNRDGKVSINFPSVPCWREVKNAQLKEDKERFRKYSTMIADGIMRIVFTIIVVLLIKWLKGE